MYRKGDRVYCYAHKSWGTVTRVWDYDYTHPVDVTLDTEEGEKHKSYTLGGHYHNDVVCLFFRDDIKFPTPVRPFEKGELLHHKPTDSIIIYDHYDEEHREHYVRQFTKDSSSLCISYIAKEKDICRANGLVVSNLKEVIGAIHGGTKDVQ